jgi:hypothetical protein
MGEARLDVRYGVHFILRDLRASVPQEASASEEPFASDRVNAAFDPSEQGRPLKSNRVRITGEFSLADTGSTLASFDPVTDGARIRVEDKDGRGVVDQRIPAGLLAGSAARGWKRDSSGKIWRFRDRSDDPANGFRKLIIEDLSPRQPGMVRCRVRSSGGVYGIREDGLPLKGVVVLGDQSAAGAGACGEASFALEECRTREARRFSSFAACRQ